MVRVVVFAARPKIVGGAERYTTDLVQGLRRSPRITKADIVYVDEAKKVDSGGYDIVHGMDALPSRITFARRLGLPVVLTCHTSPWQSTRQGWRTGRRLPWFRLGQIALYAKNLMRTGLAVTDADAVVAVGRNTLEGLRRQVPWARSRIRLVENGVDPEAFPVGLGDEGYALFVGRLSPEKGIDVAVDAFARIDRPLLVVGTGRLQASLKARATKNVNFLGNLPDREVAKLYRGASVCVFPSQSEGYPLVVLEALSSGSPVISTQSFLTASPVGDLVRWLPFGVCSGVPASRQVRQELVDHLARAVLETWGTKTPENARNRHDVVRNHNTWSRTVNGIIDLYDEVLKGRAPTAAP